MTSPEAYRLWILNIRGTDPIDILIGIQIWAFDGHYLILSGFNRPILTGSTKDICWMLIIFPRSCFLLFRICRWFSKCLYRHVLSPIRTLSSSCLFLKGARKSRKLFTFRPSRAATMWSQPSSGDFVFNRCRDRTLCITLGEFRLT